MVSKMMLYILQTCELIYNVTETASTTLFHCKPLVTTA